MTSLLKRSVVTKIAIFHVHKPYQRNRIFETENQKGDVSRAKYYALKAALYLRDIDLITSDMYHSGKVVCEIWLDLYEEIIRPITEAPRYLIALESRVVCPKNIYPKYHHPFTKVFTWSHSLLALGSKYIEIRYAFGEQEKRYSELSKIPKNGRVMIVSAKTKGDDALYSERMSVIRFYENQPDISFDFYGRGWLEKQFTTKLWRVFLRLASSRLRKKMECLVSSRYRGECSDKLAVQSMYKFAYAFENSKSEAGYVTEKLFDCLFSGSIPIYYGNPAVELSIPKGIYIDYSQFSSMYQLEKYLTSISAESYYKMRSDAEKFLHSEEFTKYTVKHFADVCVEHILNEKESLSH
jgi:alpha(1,3/1,4) fucosyltransferase